jgi:hypothetical protein
MSDGDERDEAEVRLSLQQRVEVIRRELKFLDRHVVLLKDFAEGRWDLKNKGYTRGAEGYQQTAEDKARLPRTLANLKAQRARLEREREVLMEYRV